MNVSITRLRKGILQEELATQILLWNNTESMIVREFRLVAS